MGKSTAVLAMIWFKANRCTSPSLRTSLIGFSPSTVAKKLYLKLKSDPTMSENHGCLIQEAPFIFDLFCGSGLKLRTKLCVYINK